MNKDRFYIDELSSIRAFCIHSDKEDVYKYIYDLQQENKKLKEKYKNIIDRYKFIKNRVNQGMSIENKNKCLIELGNNILQELD